MDVALLTLCILAVVLYTIAYLLKGWDLPLSGLVEGGRMLRIVFPRLLLGFALAGIIQVMIPTEYIAKIIGEGSGLKGILFATVAGAVTPGGPFMNFPIVAALYKSGASVGPLAAYLTAWAIIGINRTLVWEIPFMGAHFAFARYLSCIIFPLVIGIITPFIFKLLKW
ncbi:MAG: permease [Thermodesulfobacteriota bacterium]